PQAVNHLVPDAAMLRVRHALLLVAECSPWAIRAGQSRFGVLGAAPSAFRAREPAASCASGPGASASSASCIGPSSRSTASRRSRGPRAGGVGANRGRRIGTTDLLAGDAILGCAVYECPCCDVPSAAAHFPGNAPRRGGPRPPVASDPSRIL